MSLDLTLPADLAHRLLSSDGRTPDHPLPQTLGEILERLPAGRALDQSLLIAASPGPHRVVRGDETVFVNCALDALILPMLGDEAARVISSDPTSGEEVVVDLAGSGASHCSHSEAVVSLGVTRTGEGPFREIGCPHINLFASPESYEAWAADHPEVVSVPLTLGEALTFARALAGRGEQ